MPGKQQNIPFYAVFDVFCTRFRQSVAMQTQTYFATDARTKRYTSLCSGKKHFFSNEYFVRKGKQTPVSVSQRYYTRENIR